ncbi:MAG: bifunctional hydroxymethylpyrimidine kinase/phosphomethylpyrimidine kinase [Paramuribaculum sp.]|nr:bifunctional hydroxymethylpyrimidine kinase/phosphomethylpyrimidine kinase [Paramuribaculum sp.]MDE6782668.1 bifunctional hydroxymethylpyrimidine kinase/phosphomethylpyrimidine kinase [Paramuribaculum sp.]
MKKYIPVLSIAGSDCSGGAGIQADIKTISAIGCYAMSAITSITAQNTTGVSAVERVSPQMVRAQIDAVWADIPPLAVKTGMLFDSEIVATVADALVRYGAERVVIDPVMVSTSGSRLIDEEAVEVMKQRLFPIATLVTPNVAEAGALAQSDDVADQVKALRELGCRNILLKGGDSSREDYKIDYLYLEGEEDAVVLTADAVNTRNTHGTGCTLSSAIACYLALGFDIVDACMRGKLYVTKALGAGARVVIGQGHGPVNHLFAPRHMKYQIYDNRNR